MGTKLKEAAEAGVILGVKYAIALGLVLFALSWAIRDYADVRIGAIQGSQAFTFIQQGIQQDQARQEATNGQDSIVGGNESEARDDDSAAGDTEGQAGT